MNPRPDLLTHPNIPKPLHGVAPRDVLGVSWWDRQRQIAYKRGDFKCWACGIHKNQAAYHQWLEAHEAYDIDYAKGIVKLKEIVALCHCCHSFVHSGRLLIMYEKGETPYRKALYILNRGLSNLDDNRLKPFYMAVYAYFKVQGISDTQANQWAREASYELPEKFADWSKWRLIIDGREYGPKFKSMKEWSNYYR